jgi:hypothetical protein
MIRQRMVDWTWIRLAATVCVSPRRFSQIPARPYKRDSKSVVSPRHASNRDKVVIIFLLRERSREFVGLTLRWFMEWGEIQALSTDCLQGSLVTLKHGQPVWAVLPIRTRPESYLKTRKFSFHLPTTGDSGSPIVLRRCRTSA